MRIDKLRIDRFKNLDRFEIDFDESQLTTVLVGENATGKSNLFEAIIRIFRHLDLDEAPPFGYQIDYQCRKRHIHIEAKEAKTFASGTTITVDGGRKLSATAFRKQKDELLPKYVFAYYSGPSRRMRDLFDEHLAHFYQAQLKGSDTDSLRRLFYARLAYSQLVLLSFFSEGSEEDRTFLKKWLGITGLESVLFDLRRPDWGTRVGPDPEITEFRDGRFFGARGVVRDLLSKLWDEALAPIYDDVQDPTDYQRSSASEQHLYLYLPDEACIQRVAKKYESSAQFFKALESIHLSKVTHQVRVLVRRDFVDGALEFSELSEGEQQLLTVLGLLRFTKDEESLFLLDEPDTHLNPHWKLRYLQFIERAVGLDEKDKSQLIISTHAPLTVAGLLKSQVQIFALDGEGRPKVGPPDVDPRGLGVAGVLIELFGLPSTLDPQTQDDLDKRNRLAAIDSSRRTPEESAELRRLSSVLAREGFALTFRDPILTRFYSAAIKRPEFQRQPSTPEATEEQIAAANEILDEILAEDDEDVSV